MTHIVFSLSMLVAASISTVAFGADQNDSVVKKAVPQAQIDGAQKIDVAPVASKSDDATNTSKEYPKMGATIPLDIKLDSFLGNAAMRTSKPGGQGGN
jgi:hypothetical protein